MRPGEKLYEELFHEKEELTNTTHEKILQARYRDINWSRLNKVLLEMTVGCENNDEKILFELLSELVPEYQGNRVSEKLHLVKSA